MKNNRKEILNANYWENRKFAEELVKAYGAENTKYQEIQRECNEIVEEIHKIEE
jgi:hypothetical protein